MTQAYSEAKLFRESLSRKSILPLKYAFFLRLENVVKKPLFENRTVQPFGLNLQLVITQLLSQGTQKLISIKLNITTFSKRKNLNILGNNNIFVRASCFIKNFIVRCSIRATFTLPKKLLKTTITSTNLGIEH